MVTMTCRCGHVDDLDAFCRTTICGDLPPGEFQCPQCGYAFKRKEGGYKVLRAGSASMVIPTKVELVPIAARL